MRSASLLRKLDGDEGESLAKDGLLGKITKF
jgi:hypothetical protein